MSALQYVMAGVGALALLAGILILAKRLRTMVSGCKADAIVVDEKVEISRGKNGKEIRLSQPIFEFQHEGKTYRCQSTIGSTSGPGRGAKIKVRYLPQDPARSAEVDTFLAFFGFPLVAIGVGAALVWVALAGAGIVGK